MFQPEDYSHNINNLVILTKKFYRDHYELLKWNSEPESILDLGIGDGKMTKEVLLPIVPKSIKDYIGGDVSKPMLKAAAATVDHENFQTLQMDVTTKNLPIEIHNRFHHVFSNYLFHHIGDMRQTLVNIYEMLKPGGQLFFNAFEKNTIDEVYEKLDQGKWAKYNNSKAISSSYRFDDPLKEYKKLIESLGYIDCHFFRNKYVSLRSEESLKEMYLALNLRLPFVNEEDKEEYSKDYLKEVGSSSMVKIIIDKETKLKTYEITSYVLTGIVSKPE